MIVAFSTSSPQASVALISPGGDVLGSAAEDAPMRASGACFRLLQQLLEEHKTNLSYTTYFVADLGPGSFTGVKVGVTIAKTLAFAQGVQAAGLDSFDLISATQTVVMPSKRGEFFVRRPGQIPIRVTDLPEEDFVGFGPGIEPQAFPHAKAFAALLDRLKPVAPEWLVPNYLIEPSISQPKSPLSGVPHA